MSLQEAMLRRWQRERIFENMVRLGKAFLDIAAVELKVRANIRAFYWLELRKISKSRLGYANRFMDQSSAWLKCLMNIQYRWQFFVFDVDQTQRLFRRIRLQRRYRRDRISHMPHFFNCHDGLIFKDRAVVRFNACVLEY